MKVDPMFSITYKGSRGFTSGKRHRNDRLGSHFEMVRGGPMRAADLDIHELLHFVPEGGLITFAGERVLLLDAVALGLLRKELIETLGADSGAGRAHQVRAR